MSQYYRHYLLTIDDFNVVLFEQRCKPACEVIGRCGRDKSVRTVDKCNGLVRINASYLCGYFNACGATTHYHYLTARFNLQQERRHFIIIIIVLVSVFFGGCTGWTVFTNDIPYVFERHS